MSVQSPRDAADVHDAVRSALAAGTPVEVVGRGSRRGFGRPMATTARLDLSALAQVRIYEPAELVLTAGPSTPLLELEALLAAHGQQLAFEPPDLGPLWGAGEGTGSLGGALSVGLGGPRRPFAGAPRDHFLGFKGVNGFAEPFAAGGRVVKNVTGYDLPKLMAGAFGVLAVLTEVTVKVLPAPAETDTLAIAGLSPSAAFAVLDQATKASPAVSGAAFLPAPAAGRTPGAPFGPRATALVRLEGFGPAVEAAGAALLERLPPSAEAVTVDPAGSARLWRAIGGAWAFADLATPVWRLSIPPSAALAVGQALNRAGLELFYFDWAGGLIWACGPKAPDGGAALIRAPLPPGAHATLVRGPEALRGEVEPFQPLDAGLAALQRRLKARFDPVGIFNPGRMYGEF